MGVSYIVQWNSDKFTLMLNKESNATTGWYFIKELNWFYLFLNTGGAYFKTFVFKT